MMDGQPHQQQQQQQQQYHHSDDQFDSYNNSHGYSGHGQSRTPSPPRSRSRSCGSYDSSQAYDHYYDNSSYDYSTNTNHQAPVQVHNRHPAQTVPKGGVVVPVPRVLRRDLTVDSGFSSSQGLGRTHSHGLGSARGLRGQIGQDGSLTPPRVNTPPASSRYPMTDDSEDVFENEGYSTSSTGRRTPPRTITPPHALTEDSEDVFQDEGYLHREPPRLYPTLTGMDDSSTRTGLTSTGMPTGNHQRRPPVPSAQHRSVTGNVNVASSRFDPSMDGSSISQTSIPGATFSTDGGVFARKAGLRGRTSVRSMGRKGSDNTASTGYIDSMDESSTSVPGASHQTNGYQQQQANKLTSHAQRGNNSLRQVDTNIQQRQMQAHSQQTSQPDAIPEYGTNRRAYKSIHAASQPLTGERYRYQPGASMQSVADTRYQNKVQNQEDRMSDSLRAVDGMISIRSGMDASTANKMPLEDRARSNLAAGHTPGVFAENKQSTPQDAAMRAKLDSHFGPAPDEPDRRQGDFSHVSMLAPPRRSANSSLAMTTTTPTPTPTSIGTEAEQDVSQELSTDSAEVAEEAAARNSEELPRELTVDEDVQMAREQAIPRWRSNKDRPKLWCFTETGMCVGFALLLAVLGSMIIGLVVFNKDDESSADTALKQDNGDDDSIVGLSFEESLPYKTSAILADQDPDTPQYQAMQWLQEEDLFLSYPVWRKRQRFAMVSLYFSLHHDEEQEDMPWFQNGVDECSWLWNPDDESICDSNGRYLKLSLRLDSRTKNNVNIPGFYGIAGGNSTSQNAPPLLGMAQPLAVPPEIGMVNMERFILSHVPATARLQDLLPAELLGSNNLIQLEVTRSSEMVGTIPTEIGLATSLHYFYIQGSSMTGAIPTEVGLMKELKELSIVESYKLVGSVPTQIGRLSDLNLLWIFDNSNLTGNIPSEVGLLTDLGFFSLRANSLTGRIPSELGMPLGLNEIRLSNNDLTGTVPNELGALREIRLFDIDGNDKLGGSVPPEYCAVQVQFYVDCEKIQCCGHYDPLV